MNKMGCGWSGSIRCLKVRLDDPGAIEPGRAIGILDNAVINRQCVV